MTVEPYFEVSSRAELCGVEGSRDMSIDGIAMSYHFLGGMSGTTRSETTALRSAGVLARVFHLTHLSV